MGCAAFTGGKVMSRFSGRGGGFGRLAAGSFAQLADGTMVVGNAQGVAVPAVPQGSAAANSIPQNAGGALVSGKGIDFKYQTPTIASLANGVSQQVTIQYDQNSTFNWLRTTYSVDLAGAAEDNVEIVIPLVTLQITDQGSGMSFMNAPIPLYTIAGSTGELPYVLPTPQLIAANASFIYSFSNYSAASTYTNLRLQFHGYRIFN